MMNVLARLAIVPLAFIQFDDPATGQPMYLQKQNDKGETVDDTSKPVGVRAYTKGSQMYRNATADNTTEAIKAAKNGGKGVTGHTVYARDTEILAKTVVEYVNFDYNGAPASYETNKELFSNPEFIEVREQILADQADTGKVLEGFRESLILHVKQLAWLHAVPEKKEQSRMEALAERYGEDCPDLELPPVDGCGHIVGYLFEVGPTLGDGSLTNAELRFWQENTGVVLSEFESTMLVSLSRTYLAMYREARDPMTPRPYTRLLTDAEKIAKAKKMRLAR